MRIEGALPSYFYMPQTARPESHQPVLTEPERLGGLVGPGVVVDITPQAQAAYARGEAESDVTREVGAAQAPQECETCKNRKYVDKSDDPSVSFQTPAHLSPGQAASGVMSHEQEHVSHEQAKAQRDGRKVVSQTVTLATSICPECGRVYISGGVTRTITVKNNSDSADISYLS
jgi:hypothetical protein